MLFNSAAFLLFFPVVLCIYFLLPGKTPRNIWLLLASYFFYMSWNPMYGLLLLGVTLVTYIGGLMIERTGHSKGSKGILAVCILAVFGVLFYFKYWNFTADLLDSLFRKAHIGISAAHIDVILPVGISFYTFQAVGYLIDVWRGDIKAEKNPLKYALFISFFLQLLAGPIGRARNLLYEIPAKHRFHFEEARDGFLLMLWGYFLKLVIADRLAIFVDTVYGNTADFPGWYVIAATVLFGVQIYCDFAGYSTIALGAAEILGIHLTDNFKAPYMAPTTQAFWSRWHISLTSWFRDYLYIPLGGNRKGKFRKQLNRVIVFLVSGLWHGADLSFIVWGVLNGIYQVLGDLLKPVRDFAVRLLKIDRTKAGHRILQSVITFLLIDFSWIFFRADNINAALDCIRSMAKASNPWIFFDGSILGCGMDIHDFGVMAFSILLLAIADYLKYRNIVVRRVITDQAAWVRVVLIPVFICFILLTGVWGPGYDASNFIYFQF